MATMNPGLILQAAEGPNFLRAMVAGDAARSQRVEAERISAMNELYRDQGAGILAGDQNALNALAGFDPQAALGVQNTRAQMQQRADAAAFDMQQGREMMAMRRDAAALDRRATEQRMGILSQQERRAAQEYAAGLDAQARAAQAAELEQNIAFGLGLPDAATWDAEMARVAPDLVGQFGNREALANRYRSIADIVQGDAVPKSSDRFKVVGNSLFDLDAEGGPKPIGQGQGTTEIIYGPDGKPIVSRGPAGDVKFTEGQSKDNVYATRAEGALAVLDPVASSLTNRIERGAEIVPMGLARPYQSDDFQIAQNAGDEFLQAILRKDTGAAITPSEQELYGKTYLPQPGDNNAVLQQKQQARRRAVEAIQSGMNASQIVSKERALQASGSAQLPPVQPQVSGTPSAEMPPATQDRQPMGGLDIGYVDPEFPQWRYIGGEPGDGASWEQVR